MGTYDQKEMQFVGTHTLSASLSVTKSDRDVDGGCHPHQVLFYVPFKDRVKLASKTKKVSEDFMILSKKSFALYLVTYVTAHCYNLSVLNG